MGREEMTNTVQELGMPCPPHSCSVLIVPSATISVSFSSPPSLSLLDKLKQVVLT